MATPYTLPKLLFRADDAARQQLIDGLEEACTLSCPHELHAAMADEDRRWDDLVTRAIEHVLPEVAALLEAAIHEEYQRTPIEVEPSLRAVPA